MRDIWETFLWNWHEESVVGKVLAVPMMFCAVVGAASLLVYFFAR